jgi:peptidoglycan/xylan/chitin deacetylase (PgdA/CDA1 family)
VGVSGKVLGRAVRILSPITSVALHHRLLRRALVCPVYHISRNDTPVWWNERYAVKSPQQFERELDLLLELGSPISLDDLLNWQNGRATRPEGWFLSFDDGYRELHDVIAPILKRKGVPATFFLCSSLVDNQRPFFEDVSGLIADRYSKVSQAAQSAVLQELRGFDLSLSQLLASRVPRWEALNVVAELLAIDVSQWLRNEQPYLTGQDVMSLLRDGFHIGAHSVDHPLFSEISPAERDAQLRISMRTLIAQFPGVSRVFAFPYGEFGMSGKELLDLQNAGEISMCFGTRGVVMDGLEPFLIQRMLCEGHDGSFQSHLKTELSLQLQRLCNGQGTVRRPDLNRL